MAFRCARHLSVFSEEHKTFPLQGIQTTAGIRPAENWQQRLTRNAGPTFSPVGRGHPDPRQPSLSGRDAVLAMDGGGGEIKGGAENR